MKSNCIICESQKTSLIEVLEMMFGTKHKFNYLLCQSCKSLTLQTAPNNIEKYYSGNYYSFSNFNPSESIIMRHLKMHKHRHSLGHKNILGGILNILIGENSNYKAIRFCEMINKNVSILDVGSGSGTLLKNLNMYGFKNLNGIDSYLKKDFTFGEVKLIKTDISGLCKMNKKYDIVIMSHVLEHLKDPLESLSRVKGLLNKKGKIILRVPISSSKAFEIYKNNWFQIDAPRHFFIPSKKGLLYLTKKAGYNIDKYFFDSTSSQFISSKYYSKGVALTNQLNNQYTRKFYYGLWARFLNTIDKGDQATFILSKNNSY